MLVNLEKMRVCEKCTGILDDEDAPGSKQNPKIHDNPDVCIEALRSFLDLSHKQSTLLDEEVDAIRELLAIPENAPNEAILAKIETLQRPSAALKELMSKIDSMELAMWRIHKLLKPMRKSEIGRKADDLVCAALQVEP
jgi:hypothetical protein